jgi:hypothetical protein
MKNIKKQMDLPDRLPYHIPNRPESRNEFLREHTIDIAVEEDSPAMIH